MPPILKAPVAQLLDRRWRGRLRAATLPRLPARRDHRHPAPVPAERRHPVRVPAARPARVRPGAGAPGAAAPVRVRPRGTTAAATSRGRRRREQFGEVRGIRGRRGDVRVERFEATLPLNDAAGHLYAVHVPVVRVVELDQQVTDDRVLDARLDLGHQVLVVDVARDRVHLPRRRLEVGGENETICWPPC